MNEQINREEPSVAPPVIAPPVQSPFVAPFQPPVIEVDSDLGPRLEPVITTPPGASGKRGRFADARQRHTVGILSTAMVFLAVVMIGPALTHWNLPSSPGWARVVLLVAFLQISYAAWLVISPHWSSLWIAMIVMTGIAALYATGMAVNMIAGPDRALILDLADLRHVQGNFPTIWCGVVVLVCLLLAYACGLLSFRWRRAVAKN